MKMNMDELQLMNVDLFLQIGVAHQMSNVSIYVVDLRRVLPMGTPNRGNGAVMPAGVSEDPVSKTLFKSGTHVRRSFVREKPGEG